MPKSKESLALFELVQRAQQVETGIHERPDPPARQEEPDEFCAPGATAEPDDREPIVRKDGQRVRFSLSTAALAVSILSAMMIAMGAFLAGQQLGRSQARRALWSAGGEAQLSAALQEPTRPEVLQDLDRVAEEPRSQPAPVQRVSGAASRGWIRGQNYIWVDTFDSPDDAERARTYLEEAGIACTAVPASEGGHWRLITNQGFELPEDKTACQRLEARIRELGAAYLKTKGGRYQFNYQVTKLKGDQW